MRILSAMLLGAFILSSCSPSAIEAYQPTVTSKSADENVSEIANWLRENAIQLTTDDPDAGFEDLIPLKEIIGDARVVALGEGSHGTHEFITMRDRITRFLIEEMGFTIVAVEGDWGTAQAVDEYVRDGTGDGRDALLSIGWVTGTEEMLDLVDWMQLYNSVNAVARVSFHGLDMKSPRESIPRVSAILENIDVRTAGEARELYSCFPTVGSIVDEFIRRETAEKLACLDAVRQVYLRIEEKRPEYETMLSLDSYSRLLQEARVVTQSLECSATPIGCNRDSMMAENAAWLLEAGGPDAKIIIWAHNAHVSDRVWRMGRYLREDFGDEMINVATTFFEGSFTAMETGEFELLPTSLHGDFGV